MARSSPYVIEYRGRFAFERSPETVWASIEHTENFEAWWPWLRQFRLEGTRLEDGAVLHGVVSPPVPYQMRVSVVFEHCTRGRAVEASVHGDLEGAATLGLAPRPPGTEAEVWWAVEMMQRPMRLAARVAHPVLRWGHDRVVEATLLGLPPEFGYAGKYARGRGFLE